MPEVDASVRPYLAGLDATFLTLVMMHIKIQSLEHKNTKFDQYSSVYGLLTGSLTAISLGKVTFMAYLWP